MPYLCQNINRFNFENFELLDVVDGVPDHIGKCLHQSVNGAASVWRNLEHSGRLRVALDICGEGECL